jgi:hypothetical protein
MVLQARRFRDMPARQGFDWRMQRAQPQQRGGVQLGGPQAAMSRQMAQSPVQGEIDRIRGLTGQGLGSKGIYQDEQGNWQIRGLERPVDQSLAIRDAAIKAMDASGKWLPLVHASDAAARGPGFGSMGGSPIEQAIRAASAAAAPAAPVSPGPVQATPGAVSGRVPPTAGTTPAQAPAPSPAPVPNPNAPIGTGQRQPETIATAGMTPATTFPAESGQFPPQGQGVGRTTTPTGAEVSPTQYPVTTPQPADAQKEATMGEPTASGRNTTMAPGGLVDYPAPGSPAALGTQQPIPTGNPNLMSYAAPGALDKTATQGGPTAQPPVPITPVVAGNQTPGGVQEGAQEKPTPAPAPAPAPAPPQGTPPAPGPPSTPVVPPGAAPGSTTPSRPGQPGPVFGSPGPTPIPQQRGAGLAGLEGLGDRISAQVQSQLGQAGVGQDRVQTPVAQGLAGLGDRIRASVEQATGRMAVGNAANNGPLGPAANSIMQSVWDQIARTSLPPEPDLGGGLDAGITPAGPSTGTVPGAAPPAPGPVAPAPGSVAPAPSGGGTLGAPTGTVPHGQITGGMSWDQINQWDSAVMTAAAKYPGVDPAMVKAMMIVESGGDPNAAGVGGAVGLMQIKPEYWQSRMPPGVDLSTPQGQIEGAFAILSGSVPGVVGNTPMERFLNSYYPIPAGADATGESGHTQNMYLSDMEMYMNIIHGAAPTGGGPVGSVPGAIGMGQGGAPLGQGGVAQPGTGLSLYQDETIGAGGQAPAGGIFMPPGMDAGPAGPVVAGPAGPAGGVVDTAFDPSINVLDSNYPNTAPNEEPRGIWALENMGYLEGMFADAAATTFNNNYGFKDSGPRKYCNYANWQCDKHSGIDVPTQYDGQQFNSLVSGTVVCSGGTSSQNNPGVGCNGYGDDGGGIGQISVMEPSGAVVVYGHMKSSNYQAGDQVTAGHPVGLSGTAVIPHVHLDVLLPVGTNGEYMLVDPNLYFNNYYCDRGYCVS